MLYALQCKLFSLSCDYWMIALALLHPPHTFLTLLQKKAPAAFLLFLCTTPFLYYSFLEGEVDVHTSV